MIGEPPLGPATPEDDVAALADSVRLAPERRDLLVALLPERLPLYQGRSANETMRMRGYILASFEQAGLPDEALPFVYEELESGRDAYLVAAAAKAVRGMPGPSSEVAPFLVKAIDNIKYADDAITFEQYRPRWPLTRYTTALAEIFRTLGWLGEHARPALPDLEALVTGAQLSAVARGELHDAIEAIRPHQASAASGCCCGSAGSNRTRPTPSAPALAGRVLSDPPVSGANPVRARGNPPSPAWPSGVMPGVDFEDQDGTTLRYDDLFGGKPSIVVFFYTRCPNPNKCSLTITRLAQLQEAIAAEGLSGRMRTVAVTYDPEFDVPARLRAYGSDRGVLFGDDHRMVRTRGGFAELQERFQLGVNFTGSTVNRHRIELFILDSDADIAATFARLQWEVAEVLARARQLI
jgi:cytochrome oxidase Cu insertion factor (SCO1/SenC/PrrC family)